MKNLSLLLIITLVCVKAHAQDTVKKSNSIGNFTERYMVLKADKKVKNGTYKLFNDDKLVAAGRYDQGKRSGIWSFYNGIIETQRYDYTNHKLIFDYADVSKVNYDLPDTKSGDTIVNPVKIGGFGGGFRLMGAYNNYAGNLKGMAPGLIDFEHIVAVDENGKIVSWILRIRHSGGTDTKTVRVQFNDIPEDAACFLPAMVNGKKVPSSIIFHEDMTVTTMVGYTTTEIRGVVRSSGTATIGSGSTTRTQTGPQ